MIRDETGYNPYENIHPLMIIESHETAISLIHKCANASLNRGKFPTESKRDHKILDPKPSKESYNHTESYRPVTLESIISKCITRIMKNRLDWKFETSNILANTQEAYRKNRSCNDIVLKLTQSIQEALNLNKTTIVCISDFQSYFESIWRELLIIKLGQAGIGGKFLSLIADYLNGRKYRFSVNNIITEWEDSTIGVPQGSIIIASLLTNLYSYDSDLRNSSMNAEFSDDNIKWVSSYKEDEAVSIMQQYIDEFNDWGIKNNITIKLSSN